MAQYLLSLPDWIREDLGFLMVVGPVILLVIFTGAWKRATVQQRRAALITLGFLMAWPIFAHGQPVLKEYKEAQLFVSFEECPPEAGGKCTVHETFLDPRVLAEPKGRWEPYQQTSCIDGQKNPKIGLALWRRSKDTWELILSVKQEPGVNFRFRGLDEMDILQVTLGDKLHHYSVRVYLTKHHWEGVDLRSNILRPAMKCETLWLKPVLPVY